LFFTSSTKNEKIVQGMTDFDDTTIQIILDRVALQGFVSANPTLQNQVNIVQLFNKITSVISADHELNLALLRSLVLGVRRCNNYIKLTFYEQVQIRIISRTKMSSPECFALFVNALQNILVSVLHNQGISEVTNYLPTTCLLVSI